MAAKRIHKSRSMSLASAKSLALAFNGTRFLISGDRTDKRAWNASRDSVRGSIPACYAEVFDSLCPAFGAPKPAPAPQRGEDGADAYYDGYYGTGTAPAEAGLLAHYREGQTARAGRPYRR